MKKAVLLFVLFIPSFLFAQHVTSAMGVPVYNGQVSFRDTIPSLSHTNKVKQKENLIRGVDIFLKSKTNRKGFLILNDTVNCKMAIQITDLLKVEESTLMTYSIWAKYLLQIDYAQEKCFVEVRNIVFIDTEREKDPNPDRFNENAFTAEEMFIKNEYRMAFIKEAPLMVANAFKNEIRSLFMDIRNNIN